MQRAGVIRTPAEPNLTAISGESANFTAGGEFPVPGPPQCSTAGPGVLSVCQYSIQWKKFGVGLAFTPVVLAAGRISLRSDRGVGAVDREPTHSGWNGRKHLHDSLDQDPS